MPAISTDEPHQGQAGAATRPADAVSCLILLNKPVGVLSQFTDERAGFPRPTLAGFVDLPGVYPAGRLDFDSEGLLVLCDDGRLQVRIADPRFKLPKSYLAQVEGEPGEDALERLRNGVELKDGISQPAEANIIPEPLYGRAIPRSASARRSRPAGLS